MNVLTTIHTFETLTKNGFINLYDKPLQDAGPLAFIYEAAATHPNAEDDEVYGVAAVLSQSGKVIATFQALAAQEFEVNRKRIRDENVISRLESMPFFANGRKMIDAFGIFILGCWKLGWDVFKDNVSAMKGFDDPEALLEFGYLQVIDSGLFTTEKKLYHRSLPSEDIKKQVAGEDLATGLDLCHPSGLHSLASLCLGMGYRPDTPDRALNTLGLNWLSRGALHNAEAMTTLYWAARNNDPRLAPYRL